MSASINRDILLDDNSTAIHYNGPWTPSEISGGIFGTAHELFEPTGNVSLSVDFTGTLIRAYAFTQRGNDSTSTPAPAHPVFYTVDCLIDGSSVSHTTQPEVTLSHTTICDLTEFLPSGRHTLEMIVGFPSPNTDFSFYLDYLLVTPGASQNIGAQEDLLVFWNDAIIQTSIQQANSGWTNQENRTEASAPAQFTFQFTGVSVMWYGNRPTNPLLAASTATYTIDGGDVLAFDLSYSALLPSTPNWFNTKEYPYGDHTLHVIYQGNSNSVPLSLTSLIIRRVPTTNATFNGPTTSTTVTSTSAVLSTLSKTTPSTSHTLTSPQSSHHGVNTALIGGIVGGVVAFVLIVVAVIVCVLIRRRSRTLERTVSNKPVSSGHVSNNQQTGATGLSHATPSNPYNMNMSELQWTPQLESDPSPPRYSPPTQTSEAQIGSHDGTEWSDDRTGLYYSVNGKGGGMQIVR